MIKTLVKKQLAEFFAGMFSRSAFGKKPGGKGGKMKVALYALLMLYVVGVFTFLFYSAADMFLNTFSPMGISWLAFALLGAASAGIGIITTSFTANSVVYNAKDNDLLLSLPIKPWQIIFSRVLTLYVMDLLFTAIVMIPCFAAYIVRGNISFGIIACGIAVILSLPLVSLAVSLVLGFLVALVSGRIKNKNVVTIALSVGFIFAYFYLVSEMQTYITLLAASGEIIAENIKAFAYPLYAMGLACTGSFSGTIIFIGTAAVLLAAVYVPISMSFIKIATMKRTGAQTVYREKAYKQGSEEAALFKKEIFHFWASPTYMLNTSIGSIFILIAAVFAAIKGESLAEAFSVLNGSEDIIPLGVCAIVCAMASMNMITAPSVSLEGKNLWILRSLPVSSWAILKSKVMLHMLLSGVPSFIFAVVCVFVFPMDMAAVTIIPMIAIIFNLMFAFMGLAINLKHPNFDWTSEATPVKQGLSVILTMLVSTGIILFFVIAYIVIDIFVSFRGIASLYMLCVMLISSAITALLCAWLRKRGTKIFESL